MVKNDEDAYWLNNLSLFTIDCEHYWGPRKQKYGGKWHPWFIPMSGQYLRRFFVLWGIQEICEKWHYLEPQPWHNQSIKMTIQTSGKGSKKCHFLHLFWTPYETKVVLKYCPNIGKNNGTKFSPYFCFFWPQ